MVDAKDYGVVYVLTNPVMPGLVKIGMTTRDNVELCMKELFSTGVPVHFECKYACKVKTTDCLKIEQALHRAFEDERVNDSREFFRISPEKVIRVLEVFNEENLTTEIQDKIKRTRRPSLNYKELGILPGMI